MPIKTNDIAKEFAITGEELTRKSLRAFLLEQLRLFEAERKARCAKFGVKDPWEMDLLFVEGKVSEEEMLEDYQTVDYLTARVKRVKAMLEEVQSQTSQGLEGWPRRSSSRLSDPQPSSETSCEWRSLTART